MRLHVAIQRHDLPVTRILWTAPSQASPPLNQPSSASSFTAGSYSAQSSARAPSASTSFNTAASSFNNGGGGYTVAQLLADVNELIPLETGFDTSDERQDGGQWALEDYVVELLGSECLHFMDVGSLFREGDEIVIRPLEYDDLAARRLTGRHQISADGTHLIDGVPFGKRYFKQSTAPRPPINIPPRNKRRRLMPGIWGAERSNEHDTINWHVDEGESAPPSALAIDNRSHRSSVAITKSSRNKRDQSIETGLHATNAGDVETQDVFGSLNTEADKAVPRKIKQTKLHSQMRGTRSEHKIEKEDNLGPSSSEDSSESESATSSDTDEASDEDEPSSDSVSTISSSSTSDSSGDDSSSVSDVGAISAIPPGKSQVAKNVEIEAANPPGLGSRKTKHNNLRFKLRRRLSRLKSAGVLDKDANFQDLQAWEEQNGADAWKDVGRDLGKKPNTDEKSEFETKRAQLLRDIETGGVELPRVQDNRIPTAQSKEKAFESGPLSVDNTVIQPPIHEVAKSLSETLVPKRQTKLDLASTRRLLFGSLGIKTPKTKKDEEQTRKKLAAKAAVPKDVTTTVPSQDESVLNPDSDAIQPVEEWQNALVLRATECVYDHVELTPPPFPFAQRWDSNAQEAIKECKGYQAPPGKKRKRAKRKRAEYVEEQDEGYGDHGDYDANMDYSNGNVYLDYDGAEGVALNGDTMQPSVQEDMGRGVVKDTSVQGSNKDLAQHADSSPDALPSLENIPSLGDIADGDAKPGAIIAFKQLDMSKETNWQPLVSSYRIAVVEEVLGNSEILVRLAKRDREQPETDDLENEGPRQYSKFEMPGFNEREGEDDGVREIDLQQLIEPKLVRSAPVDDLGDRDVVSETQDVRLPEIAPAAVRKTLGEIGNAPVSSPTRQVISQMIQNAGFRSTIDSDLLISSERPLDKVISYHSSGNRQPDFQFNIREDSPIVGSPAFMGFGSSQMPEVSFVSLDGNHPGSPSIAADSTVPETSVMSPLSPLSALEKCVSPKNQSEKSIDLPSIPSDDILGDDSNAAQIDGIVDGSRIDNPDSPLSHPSSPPDTNLIVDNEQHSQCLGSSNGSFVTNPFYGVDQIDSDPHLDMPSVEDLLAGTAPNPTPVTPSKPSNSARSKRSRRPISPAKQPTSSEQDIESNNHDTQYSLPEMRSKSSKYEEPVSGSQAPERSCVVDLTLTSDPVVSPQKSDEEFTVPGLPAGPGWVTKQKPRKDRRPNKTQRKSESDDDDDIRSGPRRSRIQIQKSIV